MPQPEPALGSISHPGLAAAARHLRQNPGDPAWNLLLTELMHGQILLDGAGSDLRMTDAAGGPAGAGAEGGAGGPAGAQGSAGTHGVAGGGQIAAGSTLRIRTVTDGSGAPGLAVFTSQAEAQRTLPPERHAETITFAQSLPETVASLGEQYRFLNIDPDGANVVVHDDIARSIFSAPHETELKEALARAESPERRDAVIAALSVADQLLNAVDPTTQHDPQGARFRISHRPSDGAPMLLAFSSAPEIAVFRAGDLVFARPAGDVIRHALSAPFGGLVLDAGTRWIELGPADLHLALSLTD